MDHTEQGKPKGNIHIIVDRCKGCGFCIEFCPKEVLVRSETYNAKGYHPPEIENEEACAACGLCELICPDFAIFIVRTNELRSEVVNK